MPASTDLRQKKIGLISITSGSDPISAIGKWKIKYDPCDNRVNDPTYATRSST
ncbi:hypothetical protein BH10PLA1_BH10PLA1_04580 [soil metagenome]